MRGSDQVQRPCQWAAIDLARHRGVRVWHKRLLCNVFLVVLSGALPGQTTGVAQATVQPQATGAWISTWPMTAPRGTQTATLLLNGTVLIAGGANFASGDLASAELYHPRTGRFTRTGSMTYAREQHTATLLRTGQVLIAGGANAFESTNTANLYNPTTGTFTATGSMTVPRAFHTATLLRDGQVLVTGGCSTIAGDCNPATATLSSAELYNPTTGTWTATGSMTVPRAGHTATLLPSGQVLVAGGANGTAIVPVPIASAEVYDPATGTFTATAAMHAARTAFTATLLYNGTVLVTGGCPFVAQHCNPPVVGSAEVYVPGLAARRTGAVATRARRWP